MKRGKRKEKEDLNNNRETDVEIDLYLHFVSVNSVAKLTKRKKKIYSHW